MEKRFLILKESTYSVLPLNLMEILYFLLQPLNQQKCQ